MPQKRPGVSGAVLDRVQRWTDLSLGIAGLAAGYSDRVLDDGGEESTTGAAELTLADVVALVPGAALAVGATVQGCLFDLIAAAEEHLNRSSDIALRMPVTGHLLPAIYRWLADQDGQFRHAQEERTQRAADFLATAGPHTLGELLLRVDLDTVLANVDMDAVLANVDMHSAVSRVDMDSVLANVDMDAVMRRISVDDLLERVDINAVITDAIRELDTTGLLRESTGALASTTVGQLRTQVGAAGRMAGRVVRRPT